MRPNAQCPVRAGEESMDWMRAYPGPPGCGPAVLLQSPDRLRGSRQNSTERIQPAFGYRQYQIASFHPGTYSNFHRDRARLRDANNRVLDVQFCGLLKRRGTPANV